MRAFADKGYKLTLGDEVGMKKLKNIYGGFVIGLQSWMTGQGVKGELVWAHVQKVKERTVVVHHIDGDGSNNEVKNLRVVEISENRRAIG